MRTIGFKIVPVDFLRPEAAWRLEELVVSAVGTHENLLRGRGPRRYCVDRFLELTSHELAGGYQKSA
jgi:hypothetical protein